MVTRSSIVLLVKSQLHGQTMHPTETFISPVLFKIPCIGMVIFDLHFCSMTSKNPVAFITRGYCIAAYICATLCFCCCCFKQKENTTSPFLKLDNFKIIFLSRSEKLFQTKTHFLSHFVGSSPSRGDIFFLKSVIKWPFSYILICKQNM